MEDAELVGVVIVGRYQIMAPLGAGGEARVFRASDLGRAGAPVALKLYRHFGRDTATDLNAAAAQFEAAILRQLDHPHIVRLLDAGVDATRAASYLIFPFSASQTLADRRVAAGGQLPLAEVADIGRQLAGAIDYLHAQGVIHRDIKPANALCAADGQVALFDFGSASVAGMRRPPAEATRMAELLELREVAITAANSVAGTPEYLAPEQMRGGAIGPATDIYALGMTLYELTTGRLPFTGASMWQVMAQVAQQDAPPASSLRADLPTPASDTLARALSKIPAQRHPTAMALAEAFAAGLRGVTLATSPTDDAPGDMAGDGRLGSLRPDRLLLDLFISYSRRDAATIARLDHDLQDNGFRTWVDKSELVGGREWRRDLLASIERTQLTLVALSPAAVESKYCAMEYGHALAHGRAVLPLLIAPCAIPQALSHIQVIDFTQDYAAGLRELLKALRVYAQALALTGGAPVQAEQREQRKRTGPRAPRWLSTLFDR